MIIEFDLTVRGLGVRGRSDYRIRLDSASEILAPRREVSTDDEQGECLDCEQQHQPQLDAASLATSADNATRAIISTRCEGCINTALRVPRAVLIQPSES